MSEIDVGKFFDRIWGDGEGYRCISKEANKNRFYTDNECYKSVLGKENYFFCMALFKSEARPKINALASRAFWADVDVKSGVPDAYSSLPDAIQALNDFVGTGALPVPTYVVKSGAGLHIYWCLDEPLHVNLWNIKAAKLDAIFKTGALKVDSSRTTDISSLLRVPNTVNRKGGREPLSVEIILERQVISAEVFFKALDSFLQANGGISKPQKKESRMEEISKVLLASTTYASIESNDADKLAENCLQLGRVKIMRGDVPEPLWYQMIGALLYVKDGKRIIHEWSNGHKDYTEAATDAKIAQREDAALTGPPLCETIAHAGSPGVCTECIHYKKIKTPLEVSKNITAAVEVCNEPGGPALIQFMGEMIEHGVTPDRFFVSTEGKVSFTHPETGAVSELYPYPLFVSNRVLNDTGQYHVSIDTWLPNDGHTKITLPMSVCKDQALLTEELAAHGVICMDSEDRALRVYIIESLRKLTKTVVAVRGYTRYGWVGEEFYLLDSIYGKSGKREAVFTGDHQLCATKGAIATWKVVHEHYEVASMAYKAAYYAGFAAPLMEFTGLGGLTYSMVSSESGVGKTTVQSVVCAIYGDPDIVRAQRTDTYNSLMKRLGVLNNLPLCVDEMTNIEKGDLSEFIYQVSQGREKSRLTQTAVMQESGRWRTLVLSSSNERLSDKLKANRADSGAELARLVEVHAPTYSPKKELDALNQIVRENYGVVGAEWIKYIAANQDRVKSTMSDIQGKVENIVKWGAQGRYFTAFIVVCTTAAIFINEAFSREIDTEKFMVSLIDVINNSRSSYAQPTIDEVALAQFSKTDAKGVRDEMENRGKAAEDAVSIWLETILRHSMESAIIRKTKRVIIPKMTPTCLIDEVEGTFYLPVSDSLKVLGEAKLSSMNLSRYPTEKVRIFEGSDGVGTLPVLCYVIDFRSIQYMMRSIEATLTDGGVNFDRGRFLARVSKGDK